MENSLKISLLWASRSPLRIARNLLLAWTLGLIFLMIFSFPNYPESGAGWLWYITLGPPALLSGSLALEWCSLWLKRRDPELHPWVTVLIVAALLALVGWFIHSVP